MTIEQQAEGVFDTSVDAPGCLGTWGGIQGNARTSLCLRSHGNRSVHTP